MSLVLGQLFLFPGGFNLVSWSCLTVLRWWAHNWFFPYWGLNIVFRQPCPLVSILFLMLVKFLVIFESLSFFIFNIAFFSPKSQILLTFSCELLVFSVVWLTLGAADTPLQGVDWTCLLVDALFYVCVHLTSILKSLPCVLYIPSVFELRSEGAVIFSGSHVAKHFLVLGFSVALLSICWVGCVFWLVGNPFIEHLTLEAPSPSLNQKKAYCHLSSSGRCRLQWHFWRQWQPTNTWDAINLKMDVMCSLSYKLSRVSVEIVNEWNKGRRQVSKEKKGAEIKK